MQLLSEVRSLTRLDRGFADDRVPLTMAVASSLYGVTMQEKGVSKLVSVRIDDVQPEERRRSA